MLRDHIGYVRLRSFQSTTADEVRKAVEKLREKNVRGLVLDLRNNPGGLLSQAIVDEIEENRGNAVLLQADRAPGKLGFDLRERLIAKCDE